MAMQIILSRSSEGGAVVIRDGKVIKEVGSADDLLVYFSEKELEKAEHIMPPKVFDIDKGMLENAKEILKEFFRKYIKDEKEVERQAELEYEFQKALLVGERMGMMVGKALALSYEKE